METDKYIKFIKMNLLIFIRMEASIRNDVTEELFIDVRVFITLTHMKTHMYESINVLRY